MNKRRLLKLAALLEKDAKNKKGIKFNLRVVAKPAAPRSVKKWKPAVDCGTTACAIGLWGLSGEFPGVTSDGEGWPEYRGSTGATAAVEYFKISHREFNFMFLPHGYSKEVPPGAKGEIMVAKRIRDFVAGKVAPQTPSADHQ